jgi:hypothetical protein
MQHTGAPKKLNEREDKRQLIAITRKDPFATYDYINLLRLWIHQINISGSTLIRYLKHVDFDSYFTAYKPALFEEDRKQEKTSLSQGTSQLGHGAMEQCCLVG